MREKISFCFFVLSIKLHQDVELTDLTVPIRLEEANI